MCALSPAARHAAAAGAERGGSIESLLPFVNLRSRNDFVLVVAWLLATPRAGGPYPLLAISGEQDSAKTVLSKMLKALVDPNVAPVRALPREQRELMIAANNNYLLAFDNLSGLPAWLSDALCRLARKGGPCVSTVSIVCGPTGHLQGWARARSTAVVANGICRTSGLLF